MGPGHIQKAGPLNMDCAREGGGGSGGKPPEHFEIVHPLKRVLGAAEALFSACTQ